MIDSCLFLLQNNMSSISVKLFLFGNHIDFLILSKQFIARVEYEETSKILESETAGNFWLHSFMFNMMKCFVVLYHSIDSTCHIETMPGLDVIPGTAVSPEASFQPSNFALSVEQDDVWKVFWSDFAMILEWWYKILSKV